MACMSLVQEGTIAVKSPRFPGRHSFPRSLDTRIKAQNSYYWFSMESPSASARCAVLFAISIVQLTISSKFVC